MSEAGCPGGCECFGSGRYFDALASITTRAIPEW
jgi:hypothetical protein